MTAVIKETHLIGGIHVNVFKSRTENQTHSVAILFLLHGRKGSVKDVDSIATTIIEKNTNAVQQHRSKLWVVTLVKHFLHSIPYLFLNNSCRTLRRLGSS